MSEIIVQGYNIDTKDIYDIILETNTRNCSLIIKLIDKSPIVISRGIPYETRNGEFKKYWTPYENLYKSLKEKWDADKTNLPIFKL